MPNNARMAVVAVLAGALLIAAIVGVLQPDESPSATTSASTTTTFAPLAAPTTAATGQVADGGVPTGGAVQGSAMDIRGRVVWADGRGVRGAEVTISTTGSPAIARTAADRSGSFLLRVPAGWAAGDVELTAAAPTPAGALQGPSTTRPLPTAGSSAVAPLVLWSGRFGVDGGTASWDPAPVGGVPTLTVSVGGAEILTATGSTTQASFDPILLEDHTAATSATIRTGSGERYTTSVVPISGPGAPLSRTGACWFTSDNGVTRVEAASCGLTDGDFASLDDQGAGSRDVIIELGERRSVSTVVVRGYPSNLRIEVSTDGGVWHPFASGPGWPSPAIYRPGPTAVARYVRVLGDEVTYFSTYEISVW